MKQPWWQTRSKSASTRSENLYIACIAHPRPQTPRHGDRKQYNALASRVTVDRSAKRVQPVGGWVNRPRRCDAASGLSYIAPEHSTSDSPLYCSVEGRSWRHTGWGTGHYQMPSPVFSFCGAMCQLVDSTGERKGHVLAAPTTGDLPARTERSAALSGMSHDILDHTDSS